jgi:hypothetical protein
MVNPHLIVTDGGREKAGFVHESRDCAVREFATATDIPYARAHALLKAAGRRDRKGTRTTSFNLALATSGIDYECLPIRLDGLLGGSRTFPTLAQTVQRYSTGRYVIMTCNHAMALIDGVIHDKGAVSGSRSRIRHIYRIKTKQAAAITQTQISELWERLNKLEARYEC